MVMLKEQMEHIYRTVSPEKIPWHMEVPPGILRRLVKTGRIGRGKVIELGCGAGNYVLYFAGMGFDATGVDFSEAALEQARRGASEKGLKCTFILADVLGDMTDVEDRFDFAFDWELLHHIFPPDREGYVRNVSRLLNPGGRYLTVSFSEEDPHFGGEGKYRNTPLGTLLYFSSEQEILSLVTPCFEIEELKTVEIRGKFAPHRAIYGLMKKRL